MIYEISYFVPAMFEDSNPITYSQTVEAPAHRKGVLNSDLVKYAEDICWDVMVSTGFDNIVGYVTICEYRPARIGYRNGSDNLVVRADMLMNTKMSLVEDASGYAHRFFSHNETTDYPTVQPHR